MSIRCASDMTVLELKEELRKLGLTGTGCKSELIARLNRSTPVVRGRFLRWQPPP
jgi:hypothetical protein